jgi:O-antigen ligase
LFITALVISFLYNILWQPYPISNIKFILEMLFALVLIVVPVYLLDDGLLELIYKLYVPVSALVSCIYISIPIFNATTEIRRVGGGAFQLSGAVNNIALMFTIAIVIAVIGLLFIDKKRYQIINLISLCLLVPGLLVTGSRRMIISGSIFIVGLLITIGWFNSISIWNKMKKTSIPVSISLLGIFILYDFTGFSRYSIGSIIQSLVIRITENYNPALNQMESSVQEIMFGAGMFRYGPVAAGAVTKIVYPHNFLLSFFVHTGILTTIVLLVIIIFNIKYLFSSTVNSDRHSQYLILSTLISLLLIIVFINLGGRITRNFIFYIFMGISEYLYISEKRNTSVPLLINEYK